MCVRVQELNSQLKARPVAEDKFAKWRQELQETNAAFPLAYPKRTDVIMPQWAIEVRRHPQLEMGMFSRVQCSQVALL